MKSAFAFLFLIIGSVLADEMLFYRHRHLQLVAKVENLIAQAHVAQSIYQGKPEQEIIEQELKEIQALLVDIKAHERNSLDEFSQVEVHEKVITDLLSKQIMGTLRPHIN